MFRCCGASVLLLEILRLQEATALKVAPAGPGYDEGGDMAIGAYDDSFGYFDILSIADWGTSHSPFQERAPLRKDMREFVQHFTDRRYFGSAYGFKVPKERYNPAIERLPDAVAHRLGGGARYLLTLRHNNGQCRRLGIDMPTVNRSDRAVESTVTVLDSNFGFVASTTIYGTDCRILVDGDEIIITRVMTPGVTHAGTVHLRRLEGSALNVSFQNDRQFAQDDRNLGLLKHQGRYMVLRWPGEQMDISRMRMSRSEDELPDRALHNSVNPLELPELDAFLGVGHLHIGSGCKDCNKKRGPKYGHTYVSYFLLFDRGAPWSMRHLSPPFCIPSAANATRCETIQFLTSIVREGRDLLITYGINDCEAAMARIPLEEVLKFTRGEDGAQPDSGDAPSGAPLRMSVSPLESSW